MRNKIEERIKNKTYNKRKVLVVFLCAAFVLFCLIGRLVYLMIFDAEYYQNSADLPELSGTWMLSFLLARPGYVLFPSARISEKRDLPGFAFGGFYFDE